jgi:hypothetical protein
VDRYGPAPPWTDPLRILEPDPALSWRGVPGARRRYVDVFRPAATERERISLRRRFLPGLPAELRDAPTWDVSLNSEGFRDDEFVTVESEVTFRIACLGDSFALAPDYGDARAYGELEQWTRVPLPSYAANMRSMLDLSRQRGAAVILLYNEFWQASPYRAVLAAVALDRGVPWVDSSERIAAAQREVERELERRLGLRPAGFYPHGDDGLRVVFRVFADDHLIAEALHIAGPHPALGDGVPNAVALNDEGIRGDEREHDRVWSHVAELGTAARTGRPR